MDRDADRCGNGSRPKWWITNKPPDWVQLVTFVHTVNGRRNLRDVAFKEFNIRRWLRWSANPEPEFEEEVDAAYTECLHTYYPKYILNAEWQQNPICLNPDYVEEPEGLPVYWAVAHRVLTGSVFRGDFMLHPDCGADRRSEPSQ